MNKLKIFNKIMLLSGILMFFVLLIGGISFYNLKKSHDTINSLYNDNLVSVEKLNDARAQARANEANLLYLLHYTDNNEKKLEDISTRAAKIDEDLKAYKISAGTDAKAQEQLAEVETSMEAFRQVRENIIKLIKDGNLTEASKDYSDNVDTMEAYQQGLINLSNYEMDQAKTVFDENMNSQAGTLLYIGFIIIAAFLIGILVSVLVALKISRPLVLATNHIKVIGRGDFTMNAPEKFLKMEDEIGDIARAIMEMSGSVKNMLFNVKTETTATEQTINQVKTYMNDLNGQIEEISALTQELSAGMEETAASTQQILESSGEIEKAVESIAEKAQEGAEAAGSINDRAVELKSNSITSQETAVTIYKTTQEKLTEAINSAKEVEKIDILSKAILEITGQTNLLALNAAIEAARSGEAGKGFAVVAEQIKNLAEASKKTADEIQNITKSVVSSVDNLALNSGELLKFVDQKVISDYGLLVKTGDEYSRDAAYVDGLVTDFSATSEELLASVKEVVKAINQVGAASNEGAVGTSSIAEKNSVIARKSADVNKLSDAAMGSFVRLQQLVEGFKI